MRPLGCVLLIALVSGCPSSSTTAPAPSASAPAIQAQSAATRAASAEPPQASASASASAAAGEPSDGPYARHTAAALVSECIERRWFGYTCNNAYPEAARRFPDDAAVIQALMRLAVRVDAGKPYGGEAEVTSYCQPEKGEGAAYPCLYVADGNRTPRGKAAHALACKGAPPEGQVPVAGGTAACDGDKPIQVAPLPRQQAEDVRRCFACGDPQNVSNRDLSGLPSAKACAAVRKRVAAREAAFIEKSIEPLCPKGS